MDAAFTLDSEWLAGELKLRGQIWRTDDPRTLGTLWWYSAAPHLIGPAAWSFFTEGATRSPLLEDVVFHREETSRLVGSHSTGDVAPGVEPLAEAVRGVFERCIDALRPYVPRPRPLWAIGADAIASQFLLVGSARGQDWEASEAALALAHAVGAPMPTPRLVELPRHPRGHDGVSRHRLRRSSCCLLYLAPEQQPCTGCPRRTPRA